MAIVSNRRQPSRIGPFLGGAIAASGLFVITPFVRLPELAATPARAFAVEHRRTAITPDMAELRAIVETPHPEQDLSGPLAERRNRAQPFARTQPTAAQPFVAAGLTGMPEQNALRCLTQAVYYEAGFEPLAGRRAVAQVILNRMRHEAFPKTVCGVVYQGSSHRGCQFSFTCDGSLARRPNELAWSEARQVASDALNGHVEQSVGLATHYHANYVYPYWAPTLVKLVRIGAHIFYRWPGGWGQPGAFMGRYAGNEVIPAWRNATADRALRPALVRASEAGFGDGAENLVRMADPDPGGRLNVATGWRLHLSDPAELNRASSEALRRQSGANILGDDLAGATDAGS
jgi:spore germination cell wall hydrolase CwlJ-like protein